MTRAVAPVAAAAALLALPAVSSGHAEISPEEARGGTTTTFALHLEDEREASAMERLAEGGRAALGLDETLPALNERRVETLLLEERFQMPGRVCPQCGSLYPENLTACPADTPVAFGHFPFEYESPSCPPGVPRAAEAPPFLSQGPPACA